MVRRPARIEAELREHTLGAREKTRLEHVKRQGFRFIVVGAAATLVHVTVAVALVETARLSPFWANVPAFVTAFLVSYLGHLRWTFGVSGHHTRRMPRFLSIALMGLGFNQLIVHVMVERMNLDYRLALGFIVLAVPPLVFVASRRFAFSDHERLRPSRPMP